LAQEISGFVHAYPGDPVVPLGQAVTDHLHNPVTFTDFFLA
jgi:hypothetical protein